MYSDYFLKIKKYNFNIFSNKIKKQSLLYSQSSLFKAALELQGLPMASLKANTLEMSWAICLEGIWYCGWNNL
jgi:hypothetical protein